MAPLCGEPGISVLAIAPQLPVYHLEVTAKDASGAIIPDASVLVQDSRGIAQYPSGGGYSLKGETEYTLTVSAVGYIRQIQTITLSQDTSLEVTLQQGSSVNFRVTTATGSVTDYATIQVTSLDGSQSFNCVLDEYGYETTLFELKPGTYQYHISYQNDSQTASGQFTVPENQPSVELPVQLSYTQYKVKFAVQPANATVSLYKNGAQGAYGDPILPDENGYYTVIFGQYRYTVEAEGFVTISKTFNATDTSLKENDYVITVKLESYDDKILSNADNLLFEVSGEGMLLQEYTGVHSDIDFGYYADIDSDYDDVNLNDSLESFLSKELAVDGVQVEITDVLNMDYEQDFSVVQKDGTILYSAVADAMVDEDLGGAVFTVSLVLGYGNSTKPSEVTVIVPQHLTSRQERLDAAAEYAILFDTIKGDNTDQNQITAPLTLTDLASDMNEDFWYYSIFSSWESDHPEVINPQTGKVTPAENNTLVTLSVKAYYSAAQIEEAGFLFDPGPLGDNQSIRSITLVVPGTNPADKTILGKVITEANRLKGTEEYTNAISSVKESFDKALADAEDVYDNLAATDKEVTDAWMKLLKEIHKLGFQAGDKTQLQALYDEVKDTDLSQYQDGASKENFQTALANAETVLADKDAMQKEIDKAYDDLKAAYDALENRRIRAS